MVHFLGELLSLYNTQLNIVIDILILIKLDADNKQK